MFYQSISQLLGLTYIGNEAADRRNVESKIESMLSDIARLRAELAAAKSQLPKWVTFDQIHEEGMPYAVINANDPANCGLFTFIDDLPNDNDHAYTHAISLRGFFMNGYDETLDAAIRGAEKGE